MVQLGPFVHGLNDLAEHLIHLLPPDEVVRRRCNDHLFISLTHVPSMKNRLVHRFDGGKRQLLRAVLSSMNLPLFLFPMFDLVRLKCCAAFHTLIIHASLTRTVLCGGVGVSFPGRIYESLGRRVSH